MITRSGRDGSPRNHRTDRDRAGALHDGARQPGRDDGAAQHAGRPGRRGQRPAVVRERLHAHVRRAAADRGGPRRPVRQAARVHARPGPLHGGLGRRCARHQRRRADRRPRPPGRRRRRRHAAHADPAGAGLPARSPRRRAGHLVRHRRCRGRDRPGHRRRRRRRHLVALDLLVQRPGRHPHDRPREPLPRGEPRPVRAPRPGRRGAGHRRPGRHRVGRRARQRPRLDLAAGGRRPRRRRGRRCRVPRLGDPGRGADAAAAAVPLPRVHRHQPRVAGHVLRHVRLDLPARAVPADRAGLLGLRGRRAHAAVDDHADVHRPDRRRAVRPHRWPPADGRRAWPCRRSRWPGSRRSPPSTSPTRASSCRSSSPARAWRWCSRRSPTC